MTTPTLSASATIPLPFRLTLTTLEPIIALAGVVNVLFYPAFYNVMLSRHTIPYDPTSDFLYSAIAGGWLLLTFLEVVVLRAFDDVRVWKYVCAGILLSDVLNALGAAQAVGGWVAWADLAVWSVEDVSVLLMTIVPIGVRLCVIFGLGVGQGGEAAAKRA